MATNLTNKGVTSSYTEGLTTLAGKINNIESDIILHDDCTSDKTSNYTSSTTFTVTYNDNTYIGTISGANGLLHMADVSVPCIFQVTFKSNHAGGIILTPKDATTHSNSVALYRNANMVNFLAKFTNGTYSGIKTHNNFGSANTYYTYIFIYNNPSVLALVYDMSGTLMESASTTVNFGTNISCQLFNPANTATMTITDMKITKL